jgi:hypothetical protein
MKRQSKAKQDARVNAIFCRHFSGVQIPVLQLGRVATAGRAVLIDGGSDEQIAEAMRQIVQQVRTN